jgi:hypothetical protein
VSKKNAPPLVLEELQDRSNHLYLTLIEYKKEKYLTIIDNISGSDISAFVLDYADAESLDLAWILSVANIWYYKSSEKYPLSFEFAKLGVKNKVTPILRTFNIDYVSRMIGKIFVYDIDSKPKIKRKRVNLIPSSVEIKLKRNKEVSVVRSGTDVDFQRSE